jgi:hypothetical protein
MVDLSPETIAAICDALLPRLVAEIRAANNPQPEQDAFMTVLATQGPYAAQQWQKTQMKRRNKT